MAQKIFDVLIRSKWTPEGVRGALKELKSLGEAMTFINMGVIQPLIGGIQAVVGAIEKVNPERGERLRDAFANAETAIAHMVDNALGPAADEIARLVNDATLLANAQENLAPVYDDFFKTLQREGKTTTQIIEELIAAQERAAKAATPDHDPGAGQPAAVAGRLRGLSGAGDAQAIANTSIAQEDFRAKILESSKTLEEYIRGLLQADVATGKLKDAIDEFNQAKGLAGLTPENLATAQQDYLSQIIAIDAKVTQVRADAAQQRTFLLEDIAIREGDRIADVARRNARQLEDIEAQRIDAISRAGTTLNDTLAKVAQDGARERLRIDEDYQEQKRRIEQSSSTDIEEAIRKRDARALAAALNSREEQLNDAKTNHDKQAAEQAAAQEEAKQQARQAAEDAQRAADEAARKAKEQMQRANEDAAEDASIAAGRQARDFDRNNTRRLNQLTQQAKDEKTIITNGFKEIRDEYTKHFEEMERITAGFTSPGSALMNAFRQVVQLVLQESNQSIARQTPSRSGGRGGR